jgi:hypothetical protein
MNKLGPSSDYIKTFFVGLMDGDGSIQVNHWRKSSLQFRMVIKLKNLPANSKMLMQISSVIGGWVRIESSGDFVLWVTDSKSHIYSLLSIFNQFPPLTTRLKCQLSFLTQCLTLNGTPHQNVNWYLQNRDLKFKHVMVTDSAQNLLKRNYIHAWISGFTEAEGCFTLRTASNGVMSFSISQKTDYELLLMLGLYFNTRNLPRLVNSKSGKAFFIFETASCSSLLLVCEHFRKYPLLGATLESFNLFATTFFKLINPLKRA